MSDLFKAPIKEQSAQEIADHFPSGLAWDLKNNLDSNIRKLIRCLAASHNAVENKIEELHTELDIDESFALLNDWEKSVLLPDGCFGALEEIEARRNLVKTRLRRETIVTIDEFQDKIDEFIPDANAVLYCGATYFSFEYDFEYTFSSAAINDKFILVIEVPFSDETFEYDFEFPFENGRDEDKLICFIKQFLPANVYPLIVNAVPLP